MPLEISHCWFAYRRKSVFSDFHYSLRAGSTVLLGPNGAGKSTLLSLAASVRRPHQGTITYRGMPATSRDYRRKVAWMPQHITAMSGLTAREQVAFVGWTKGMNRSDAWSRAAAALQQVDLADKQDVKTTTLSGGQLRRVGVAQALVHDADVLLLDEPTAGMDPRQRRVFRDVLARLPAHVAVLLSTHDVADLAEESDNVTVLDGGKLTYNGDTGGFLAHAPHDTAPARRAEAAYSMLSGGE
ncbi:ATP-binding cassette domain-containing protein [Streptomyces lydicus]|uniref:ATP-binding cassette domain-containing protein n=1 Tax=Streptomyces lydicus TaxID=47763 RepID=UPI0010111B52|nr:ATP-binding cassette domain-containing protein [Streptomyces lydicus]MCZ1008973.1 ATP-binding cassette domain-containing protein [Streptomyces lydicus]